MRVTGGEYGGRRIDVPPGEIRPAMDRMRESVFSILGSALGSFEGRGVLDLFSGSGSMALEALSRGARHAVLVERDRGKVKVVRQNFSYVEAERWKLVIAPVERYLKRAGGGGGVGGGARGREGGAPGGRGGGPGGCRWPGGGAARRSTSWRSALSLSAQGPGDRRPASSPPAGGGPLSQEDRLSGGAGAADARRLGRPATCGRRRRGYRRAAPPGCEGAAGPPFDLDVLRSALFAIRTKTGRYPHKDRFRSCHDRRDRRTSPPCGGDDSPDCTGSDRLSGSGAHDCANLRAVLERDDRHRGRLPCSSSTR